MVFKIVYLYHSSKTVGEATAQCKTSSRGRDDYVEVSSWCVVVVVYVVLVVVVMVEVLSHAMLA